MTMTTEGANLELADLNGLLLVHLSQVAVLDVDLDFGTLGRLRGDLRLLGAALEGGESEFVSAILLLKVGI